MEKRDNQSRSGAWRVIRIIVGVIAIAQGILAMVAAPIYFWISRSLEAQNWSMAVAFWPYILFGSGLLAVIAGVKGVRASPYCFPGYLASVWGTVLYLTWADRSLLSQLF